MAVMICDDFPASHVWLPRWYIDENCILCTVSQRSSTAIIYICELGKSWDELRNSSPNVEKMRVFGIQDWFLTMCDAFEMKPSLEARPWTLRSTVDGRNPAPVDRWFIPLSIGFQPSKMVQDFFHPQYHWISPQLYFASNSSRIH